MPRTKMTPRKPGTPRTRSYAHPEARSLLRPDVGTQAQFKKKKPPGTYRYDSSLSPALDWDGQNGARELAEWLLARVEEASGLAAPHRFDKPREFKDASGVTVATAAGLRDAVDQLRRLGRPFLDWTGKAERLSFDVPTLPLFVHERLSTKAIIETLKGHRRDRQATMFELFGDPSLPIRDQVLRAYEHVGGWVNRAILGDSLVVMNSLLRYEGLGGQVQMIYIDPPYGVKFGSNFQPFIRRRDVRHNDDQDMTREPEMVKAYRDTWVLGLHSYLTYLRDRLLLCRELLTSTGSIFVQISDENVHHVRELMDEVFGDQNFAAIIAFTKTAGGLESTKRIPARLDYLLWYARDAERLKYHALFERRVSDIEAGYNFIELLTGEQRSLTNEERSGEVPLPERARLFRPDSLTKPGPGAKYTISHKGTMYDSGRRWWGMPKESLEKLIALGRVRPFGNTLRYIRYLDDFPFRPVGNLWDGLVGARDPLYVVQTNDEVIARCLLMCTEPGDLVFDPTCGSGTTAYVSEQWGRRWITMDVSRVPLALARQRLLTATFPWYELTDTKRGPAGGFHLPT